VDGARLAALCEPLFRDPAPESHGKTSALLVVQHGRIVLERYAAGVGRDTPLRSWSMAKSITHALVGLRRGDGHLDVNAPAPVPAWQRPGDPRRAITLEHLLRMLDGLDFVEVYEATGRSDVVEMLFGAGKDDVAAFADARPAAHPPGRVWSYSSGTTNIVAAILARSIGGGQAGLLAFMQERLFRPLGMTSATPRFDAAGNFVASSYVFATARDFARFGLLYLRDGVWEGRRLLPEGWVDHARTPTPGSGGQYGAHWWLALDGSGIFSANGFRCQYILAVPSRDLVVVRLGESDHDQKPALLRSLKELVGCFPAV